MEKLMDLLVSILAIIGLACVVKHFMHCEEGCCLCSLFNMKKDEKSAGEKQEGSRYGSNPVKY